MQYVKPERICEILREIPEVLQVEFFYRPERKEGDAFEFILRTLDRPIERIGCDIICENEGSISEKEARSVIRNFIMNHFIEYSKTYNFDYKL